MSKSILIKPFKKLYKNNLIKYLQFFIVLNVSLYFFVNKYNDLIPFNHQFYKAAVHFYEDPRINGKKFDFLKSTSVYDSQWYLEIAKFGYPKLNIDFKTLDIQKNEPHKYAFFPLYPTMLFLLNIPVNNLELTAIGFSLILMIINFFLLYHLICLIDTKNNATKTAFLLFIFPLSVFYRFIFTEGLFFALLLLFSIFLFKKKFYLSSLFLGLSLITRANSFLLIILLFLEFNKNNENIIFQKKILKYLALIFCTLLPITIWSTFNYYQTGNFFSFLKVRDLSNTTNPIFSILTPALSNVYRILEFPFLPLHAFADSKLEVIAVFLTLYLLVKSKNSIDYRLWWIAFSLWIFPLITTPLISYSRYQIISFPLFYFLIKKLKKWQFICTSTVFIFGLFILSLYFVNWFWLG